MLASRRTAVAATRGVEATLVREVSIGDAVVILANIGGDEDFMFASLYCNSH